MFDDLIAYIFKAVVIVIGGLVGMLTWMLRVEKGKIDNHEKEIAVLKTQVVTEDKVREIVVEAMNPFREDLKEIKDLVKENSAITRELEIQMAQQSGYQKAIKEIKSVN